MRPVGWQSAAEAATVQPQPVAVECVDSQRQLAKKKRVRAYQQTELQFIKRNAMF